MNKWNKWKINNKMINKMNKWIINNNTDNKTTSKLTSEFHSELGEPFISQCRKIVRHTANAARFLKFVWPFYEIAT